MTWGEFIGFLVIGVLTYFVFTPYGYVLWHEVVQWWKDRQSRKQFGAEWRAEEYLNQSDRWREDLKNDE
jgi:hypothetical protein